MTTKEDIKRWIDRCLEDGDKYMIVMCDSFDYDDYPVGFKTVDECIAKYNNPGNMQRVMEVYDLTTMNIEAQLNEGIARHLPSA